MDKLQIPPPHVPGLDQPIKTLKVIPGKVALSTHLTSGHMSRRRVINAPTDTT